MDRCSNCGKPPRFYCCQFAVYCGYLCQRMHWCRHVQLCDRIPRFSIRANWCGTVPTLLDFPNVLEPLPPAHWYNRSIFTGRNQWELTVDSADMCNFPTMFAGEPMQRNSIESGSAFQIPLQSPNIDTNFQTERQQRTQRQRHPLSQSSGPNRCMATNKPSNQWDLTPVDSANMCNFPTMFSGKPMQRNSIDSVSAFQIPLQRPNIDTNFQTERQQRTQRQRHPVSESSGPNRCMATNKPSNQWNLTPVDSANMCNFPTMFSGKPMQRNSIDSVSAFQIPLQRPNIDQRTQRQRHTVLESSGPNRCMATNKRSSNLGTLAGARSGADNLGPRPVTQSENSNLPNLMSTSSAQSNSKESRSAVDQSNTNMNSAKIPRLEESSPDFPELVADFEESCTLQKAEEEKPSGSRTLGNPKKTGFERGLKPLEILGGIKRNGKLLLLLLWEGSDEVDLVPAEQANEICPQLVIKFYEQRLRWAFKKM